MDLIVNKFYSSVSQLSGVLPGNLVTREYDMNELIASAGIGLLWKVYRGSKKTTKQPVSIFVFEKKQMERFQKDDKEQILETLKKGITQLTKIRHPQVLTIEHPLEESRDSLLFVTEPIFASLANILGSYTNLPQPVKYKLHDVEIKYGLMQLSEGLGFLHKECRLLHRNITPESIIVNHQGAWKIFGFDYCILAQNPHDAQPFWPYQEYNFSLHALTQPSLEYLAPENVLISSHFAASDIYSLGVLIYAIYSSGKPIKFFGKDFSAFRRYAADLKKGVYPNLTAIPDGLLDQVKLMLSATPEMRPDIHQFTKVPFFDDVGVKTLSYLDSLFQWDNLQKSKFYKGLPQIIKKLPHRINVHRIMPCLVKEFVNPPMIPFVLPIVLLIAENCTKDEYNKHIFVELKPVMKIQDPIQILLIFMQKMDLLLKMTPAEDIKTDVLPMLYRALESDSQQIQELCLSILPTFASLIDYPSMKNALLPRIKKLCLSTKLISVRVNCLLCIGKLLDHLDKWLVLDEVIPFLSQIQAREPAVLMAIVGIYKLTLNHTKLGLTKEVLASKAIPFLVPLCIENGLTLTQFNAIIALIKTMVEKVEVEHRSKLEQLSAMQKESSTLKYSMPTSSVPDNSQLNESIDNTFSDLGLDTFLNDFESSNDKESSNSSVQYNDKALSLQDKQRMLKQQEANQRFQPNSVLQPTASAMRILNKPKDLTSSLLDSNLSQLKLSHSTEKSNFINNNTTTTTFQPMQYGNMTSYSNFENRTTPNSRSSNSLNMNAFDSLLSPTEKKNSIPTSKTLLLLQHSTTNPSSQRDNKKDNILSHDDIMEFLK